MTQRLFRQSQKIPEEYSISHWDDAQLVRGETHLADKLTVADEHLGDADIFHSKAPVSIIS